VFQQLKEAISAIHNSGEILDALIIFLDVFVVAFQLRGASSAQVPRHAAVLSDVDVHGLAGGVRQAVVPDVLHVACPLCSHLIRDGKQRIKETQVRTCSVISALP